MKIVFLGATQFSYQILDYLIQHDLAPVAVFSIPAQFNLKQSKESQHASYKNANYADLAALADQHRIPHYFVSGNDNSLSSYLPILQEIKADIILVMGWYYLVPKAIRETAKHGAVGLHASLLPAYTGGSPLVWALINGERETGISLFRLDSGVDTGDILAQKAIPITHEDNIASLYAKVSAEAKPLILTALHDIQMGKAQWKKQPPVDRKIYPIRQEKDGIINWNSSSLQIYNFVRAQTRPYPCAFSYFEGEKIKFVKVEIAELPSDAHEQAPGQLIESVGGPLIRTQDGAIKPLVVEISDKVQSFSEHFTTKKIKGCFTHE